MGVPDGVGLTSESLVWYLCCSMVCGIVWYAESRCRDSVGSQAYSFSESFEHRFSAVGK